MRSGTGSRTSAIAVTIAVLILSLSIPASAAGPKRIFITKYDENFKGQAGVTFELYEDTDGDGVRDDGEPKLQTKVTDAAGSATFDPVNPGKYIVHEVTPAGYVDNPDQAVEIPNAKGKGPTIVFSNTPKPANGRVNDPSQDASFGDGTHIFDFGPSVAVACVEEQQQRPLGPSDPCPDPQVLVAWNHSAGFLSPGGVSGVGTALSLDGGITWGDYSKAPTGGPNTAVLGEPVVIFDPVHDRWVMATDAVTNTGSGIQFPILVSTSGGPFGFWDTPLNVTPDLPFQPAVAHGPSLDVDPVTGAIHVTFIRSNADETSEAMVTTSTDGGNIFSAPIPISDPGQHFDFIDSALGPNGALNVVFGEYTGPGTYDVFFNSSSSPEVLWGSYFPVATDVPRSGTSGLCGGSARSLFGQVAALDAPRVAVSPTNANRIFVTYPRHGPGTDESDLVVSTSTDGGATWTTPQLVVPPDGEPQFAPSISVTPDGRVATAYYDSAPDGTDRYVDVIFHNVFTGEVHGVGPPMRVSDATSDPWEQNPTFDSHFSNCFGTTPLGSAAPGSGFFFAWADGRDPGPVGNNGIDPNIYFARTEGPALSTTLSASVGTTASKIKVDGALTPRPIPGAKVTVTLFLKSDGGFDKVGRKRPTTSQKNGAWSTSFARPDGGTCRIVVEFGGAEGRAPSVPVTKTFAC